MNDKIIKRYLEVRSMKLVAEEFSTTLHQVWKILKNSGTDTRASLSCRKYEIDERVMDIIDCQWKAYFLGLLYADGNIRDTTLRVTLVEKDKEILEFVNRKIFKNKGLLYYKIKPLNGNERQSQCSLIITNKHMSNSIRKLGLFENKSLTIEFPSEQQVPDEFIPHFIRGYFDGDGCIHNKKNISSKNCYGMSICVSNNFALKLQSILKEKYDIQTNITKIGKISKVCADDKKQIAKFYNLCWKDCEVCLTRKREKFEDMISNTDWKKLEKITSKERIRIRKKHNYDKWYLYILEGQKLRWLYTARTEKDAIERREKFKKQNPSWAIPLSHNERGTPKKASKSCN